MEKITAKEFETRLAQLCTKVVTPGLPRKRRDQRILLMSVVLTLKPEKTYTEKVVNAAIEYWLGGVGRALDSDHVSVRRYLVDEKFLSRDAAGKTYRVDEETVAGLFEPEVLSLDPAKIVTNARAEREARKRAHLAAENRA